MPKILAFAPLPPFLASAFIAFGILSGRLKEERGEKTTTRVALSAAILSLLLILAAFAANCLGLLPKPVFLGTWINSGTYHIDMVFTLDSLGLAYAGLSVLFAVLVLRFSVNYMHRETGFHRFFLVLSLFTGAMLVLSTAGNAALCFVGWELAGVSSYLLIAYYYDRPTATANATQAIVTNRIGDVSFILGIALSFHWTGGINWTDIIGPNARLEEWQAGVLSSCFLLAAMAKSALVPFSPWLARAMEGPTPSSAIFYGSVMIHAGVYLVLRLQPLFEQAPLAMDLMAMLGLATALYGFLSGLAQTDVKSALVFSISGQLGLMFFAAGMGYWRLALWHLCAHAVFRGYQFLTAPSLMHDVIGLPQRPVRSWLGRWRILYVAALQRFWLENLADRLLVKPVQGLSADFQYFDRKLVNPIFGQPSASVSVPDDLAQAENKRLMEQTGSDPDVLRVSGLPGFAVSACANALHWFEEKLVLQSVGQNMIVMGRRLGTRLNRIEDLLNQPRYLVVFILATLLAVF